MLIALIVIIGLSVLILGHEAGHFAVAKLFGMKVDEFSFGFGPRITSRKIGEVDYRFNWFLLGGYVKIAGESGNKEEFAALPEEEKKRYFSFQPLWKRSLVLLAGVCVNFILGWILFSSVLMIGEPPVVVVSDVQKNSPAEAAGMREGDVLTGFKTLDDFISFVNQHKGKPVAIEVRRDGKDIQFNATPRTVVVEGQGALGVLLAGGGAAALPFTQALAQGFQETALFAWLTLKTLGVLVKDLVLHASLIPGVTGPFGIFSSAREAGSISLLFLLNLLGLVSVSLAVFNLMPFPILDGGNLLLNIVKKLKKSGVSQRVEMWINVAGAALLAFLFIIISIRDISHWF